jgi:excinuclease UvrABC nuclease subunit
MTEPPWLNIFDASLPVQPPLGDEQAAGIPAKRGVFLLTGSGGEPILLATAASIRARLRGRLEAPNEDTSKRAADLREITAAIHWKLAGGHFETEWQYLELARQIYPRAYQKMLAYRPAWFVRVIPDEAYPHFERTRDVPGAGGRVVGPFYSGRDAERFIDVVQDTLDLCRDVRCLRRSPNAPRCSYGQMGRCLAPCDGSISMEDYRRAVAGAADFAAGGRAEREREWQEQMRRAAAALEFERAGALKVRLARLAELQDRAFEHVAPLEEFRFLLVQPSGSRKRMKTFFVVGGEVAEGPPLPLPVVEEQVRPILGAMAAFSIAAPAGEADESLQCRRIALVSHYLFADAKRKAVFLRWDESLAPEAVKTAVEEYLAEDEGENGE